MFNNWLSQYQNGKLSFNTEKSSDIDACRWETVLSKLLKNIWNDVWTCSTYHDEKESFPLRSLHNFLTVKKL